MRKLTLPQLERHLFAAADTVGLEMLVYPTPRYRYSAEPKLLTACYPEC